MAKQRYSGALMGLYVDVAQSGDPLPADPPGATTWKRIALMRETKSPNRTRGSADVTGSEDTDYVGLPTIPQESQMEFMNVWDPNDADDATLSSLFISQAEADFVLRYNNGTKIADGAFTGRVQHLDPQTVNPNNGLMQRVRLTVSPNPTPGAPNVTWTETDTP